MTPKRRQSFALVAMATAGIALMLTGIGLHWWRPDRHSLEWIPQLVGASIAFAAFYGMDSRRAEGAGGFLLNAGVKILAVIRTGKRDDDPVITVSQGPAPTAAAPALTLEIPAPAPRAREGNRAGDVTTFPAELEEDMTIPPRAFIPAKEKGEL